MKGRLVLALAVVGVMVGCATALATVVLTANTFQVGFFGPSEGSTFALGFECEAQIVPSNLTFGVGGVTEIYWHSDSESTDESTTIHGEAFSIAYGGIARAGLRLVNTEFLGFDVFVGGCWIESLVRGRILLPVWGAGIDLYTKRSRSIRLSMVLSGPELSASEFQYISIGWSTR